MNQFHWQCNNKIRTDKKIAIIESEISKQSISFCAPDNYNNVDWSEEPTADWEDILRDRAQQLRDNYKKVRLWYSGGSDSHKVLLTFIKNNIHIDEIIVKIKMPLLEKGDYEVLNVAIPRIQSLQHLIPKTKVIIIDSTIEDFKDFFNIPYWWDTIIRPVQPKIGLPGATIIGLSHLGYDRYAEDNCINLITRDKPYLVYTNKKWYAYWVDSNVMPVNQYYSDSISSFYIDNPVVHLKQCHMLKNYIEENFAPDKYNYAVSYNSKLDQTHWTRGCGRIAKDESISTAKMMQTTKSAYSEELNIAGLQVYQKFCAPKELSRIAEFIKHGHNDIVEKWMDGLEQLQNFAGGKWWNNGRAEDGYVGIVSDFYCLTDGSIKTVKNLFPNGFDKSKLP